MKLFSTLNHGFELLCRHYWLIFVFTIGISLHLAAQEQPARADKRYKLDHESLSENILKRAPADFMEKYRLELTKFSDDAAKWTAQTVHQLSMDQTYTDLEVYLNMILQQVMPEELEGDSNIRIYVRPSPYPNAAMSPSGAMFMNIGEIAEANNEAELAAVMCHELAHYHLGHTLRSVTNENEGKYKKSILGFILDDSQYQADFKVGQETEADSLGLLWLSNSDYSATGHLESTLGIKRRESQQNRLFKYIYEDPTPTHPVADERIALIQRMASDLKQDTAYQFIIGQNAFKKFNYEAKQATLQLFLTSGNYGKCVLEAFRHHILDTNDASYIHFIMEAIRIRGVYDNTFGTDLFVTEPFFSDKTVFEKYDGEYRLDYNKDLFEVFDPEIMALSAKKMQRIQTKHFWQGNPPFRTNQEAFEYFYKFGKTKNCIECDLSYALHHLDSSDTRPLLRAYAGNSSAKYPEFANALISESLRDSLKTGTWVIYDDLEVYAVFDKKYIHIITSDYTAKTVTDSLASIMAARYPERKFIHSENLMRWNPEAATMISGLSEHPHVYDCMPSIWLSFGFKVLDKAELPPIYMVEPRYWYLLRYLGIDEIQFLRWRLEESTDWVKSVERYNQFADRSYDSYISMSKRTRFLTSKLLTLQLTQEDLSCYFKVHRNQQLLFKEVSSLGVLGFTIGLFESTDEEKAENAERGRH